MLEGYIGTRAIQAEPAVKHGKNGYKVVYEDGFEGWYPEDVFECTFKPCTGMTFGLALESLKRGKKVACRSWKNKDDFLLLTLQLDGKQTIAKRVGDHRLKLNWTPTQDEMLSDVWYAMEFNEEELKKYGL